MIGTLEIARMRTRIGQLTRLLEKCEKLIHQAHADECKWDQLDPVHGYKCSCGVLNLAVEIDTVLHG